MRTLVINLDRSPDRLRHMADGLGALGLPFERLPAIDGAALPAAERRRFASPDGPALTVGELGCLLSHREAWRRIAAGSDRFVAVLEDDLRFGPAIVPFLQDADWVPPDADIVKLETREIPLSVSRFRTRRAGREIRRLFSRHGGTAAYVMSRACARGLSALPAERLGVPVDFLIFNTLSPVRAPLRIYQVMPAPCVQDDWKNGASAQFPSEIAAERSARAALPGTGGDEPRAGLLARLLRRRSVALFVQD